MHDFTGKSLDELLRHKSAAADVNAQDFVAHETPLHKAIRLNMLENALTLLNYGADPNVADATGRTVMHLAAASLTDIRVWNALLRKGGRVDACVVETASGGGGAEVAASGATQSTARTVANKLNNSVAKAVIAQFDSTDTSNSFGSERFQPHVTN
jgi:ankyrin repeat protein